MGSTAKSLHGKRALVTGATSGIGWNIARLLAQRGACLVLTCRRADLLEGRHKEIIANFKVDCRVVPTDLSCEEGVGALLDAVRDSEIDILVNNAGTISYGGFQELPWASESRQVYLLTVGPIRLVHALLPGMLERGFGRILNVASVAGLMPGPYFATYNASKSFLITFSESLAGELRGTPVTCGCLLPGTTRTEFWNVDRLKDKIGARKERFMPPQKVAQVAVHMIEKGETFRIVGISNRIKQFILRRLAPRTVVNKVLTDHCFSELMLTPKTKPPDYTDGAASLSTRELIPGGMCPYLAHSVIPYILTLSGGGKFPWMELDDPLAVDVQCPNPGGAVAVRVKQKGDDFNIEVRKVRGYCVKGYKSGDRFIWPRKLDISLTDLNVMLGWLENSGTENSGTQSLFLRKNKVMSPNLEFPCPPKADFILNFAYYNHRCRYHKWPRRESYAGSDWIPAGLCPELFHAAYPSCFAMLYGGGREAQSEIACPQSGKVRLKVEIRARPTIKLREMATRGLRLLKMNTEIPLYRCYLRVVDADKDCPFGMKDSMTFEFNMGELPHLCPAMFHNIYPVLAARLRGAPFPWPELAGGRGVMQCPDNVSNITMSFAGASRGAPRKIRENSGTQSLFLRKNKVMSPNFRTMNRRLLQFVNAARLGAGIIKSKALGRRMPLMVSFHVTNRCNMRCPYCYANYDNRFSKHTPDFTTGEIKHAIDDLYDLGMRWLTLLGGEPMLRDDIGEIIRHAKSKGMLLEIVTNGYLVPKKLDEILPVDFVCLSIEGNEEQHDRARNMPGSYRAIINALEALKGRGPNIRLHATLLRSTIAGTQHAALLHLSELSRRYGAEFGYSQVITHDYNDTPDVHFTDAELREFWGSLRSIKAQGHPCYNSDFVLDYVSNWPPPYRRIIERDSEFGEYPGFDFLKCQYGRRYCYIDSEGCMFRCIVRGIRNGSNIREVGVKEAWRRLAGEPCVSCGYIQHIEANSLLNLNVKSIVKGVKYILRRQ